MFEIYDNKIYLTRGDTAILQVKLKDIKNASYELQEEDTVYFRLKKKATNESSIILIEKIMDKTGMTVTLNPKRKLAQLQQEEHKI